MDSPQGKSRVKLLEKITKKNSNEISDAKKDFEKFLKTSEARENEKAIIALAEAQIELLESTDGIAASIMQILSQLKL